MGKLWFTPAIRRKILQYRVVFEPAPSHSNSIIFTALYTCICQRVVGVYTENATSYWGSAVTKQLNLRSGSGATDIFTWFGALKLKVAVERLWAGEKLLFAIFAMLSFIA